MKYININLLLLLEHPGPEYAFHRGRMLSPSHYHHQFHIPHGESPR